MAFFVAPPSAGWYNGGVFANRLEAGKLLAEKLKSPKGRETVVLGIARGGVVVAYEVAKKLGAPLDVLVVKKIGAPGNPELAIGAVGPQKTVVWDEELSLRLGVGEDYREYALKQKSAEQKEKEKTLRGQKPLPTLAGKMVILVDDGIATGATTEAAVAWIRNQDPKKIILAVPVAPPDSVEKLRSQVDELICLRIEPDFWAVGQFYQEFPQVEDEEVIELIC